MGSYFSERWDAVAGLPAAVAEAPLLFAVLLLVFGPLIWWKWWAFGKSTQTTLDSLTHGLRTDADRKSIRHETGIGTRDIMVMRPARLSGMIYFALLFFGGGALFYIFLYMPSDLSEPSDWWVTLGLSAFTLAAMIVIEVNQTRIHVDDRTIQKRRVLHRRQTIAFTEISSIAAHGKNYVNGLVIHTGSGDKMRVTAGFSGYLELIDRLAPYDKNMGLMSKLQKVRPHARTARG